MGSDVTTNSRVVVSHEQVSCDLDGEAAILNLATGVYFGLDAVGASIWQRMQQPVRVGALCAALMEEFDVDAVTAETDLLNFLTEMRNEGLVELLPDDV